MRQMLFVSESSSSVQTVTFSVGSFDLEGIVYVPHCKVNSWKTQQQRLVGLSSLWSCGGQFLSTLALYCSLCVAADSLLFSVLFCLFPPPLPVLTLLSLQLCTSASFFLSRVTGPPSRCSCTFKNNEPMGLCFEAVFILFYIFILFHFFSSPHPDSLLDKNRKSYFPLVWLVRKMTGNWRRLQEMTYKFQ